MNIFERIAPAFSSRVNNLQHGFMPKTGTIEAIEAIKTAMMFHISKCEPLWLTFIDFTKVFDHVYHVKRMEALKNCGVGGKCLRILIWTFTINRKFFTNTNLKKYNLLSEGVRQGCVLSPILFISNADGILQKLSVSRGKKLRTWKSTWSWLSVGSLNSSKNSFS